jgi:DNA-binding NtrC family response regulator
MKGHLIGKSKAMAQVFELIERVAGVQANVMISGESGTGKEVVARAIHAVGPRKNKPFVAVNVTAIPDTLLESELFGHAKGAFTGAHAKKKGLFEEANGGTLFLDEIGDMDISLQAKLLRVIQERKVRPVGENQLHDIDVRLITATHKDLKQLIKDGLFREDLYYRMAVIPITLPGLRHRREDIPLLANFFLQRFATQNKINVRGFTAGALGSLMNRRWDGNVRELENMIERLVVMSQTPIIHEKDIPLPEGIGLEEIEAEMRQNLPSLADLERRYLQIVLDSVGGKKDKAARILGINRRTLYRKERDYGLIHDDTPEPEDETESPNAPTAGKT